MVRTSGSIGSGLTVIFLVTGLLVA
jgi:hypothetical protein